MATPLSRAFSWLGESATAQSWSTTAISPPRRGGRGDFALVENGNAVFAGVGDVAEAGIAIGRSTAAEIGGPAEAEVADHLMIGLGRAPISRQIISDHGAVSAGEENPAL